MTPQTAMPAVVSRAAQQGRQMDEFLRLSPAGEAQWTSDLDAATAFTSMREATRAALRLPASLRAFGLPIGNERSRPH